MALQAVGEGLSTMPYKVRQPVLFIWFIWFVWFFWLNETNQMNQINQITRETGLVPDL